MENVKYKKYIFNYMLKLLYKIKKNPYIVNIVSAIVLLFFVINPRNLKYLFETTLGRVLFLLFITTITYCNSFIGIMFIVVFIGLYNSKVFEGMENNSNNEIKPASKPNPVVGATNNMTHTVPETVPKKLVPTSSISNTPVKKQEGFQDRSRMLASEENIRSKSSNNLMNFDKSYFKSSNPSPNCSGIENFSTFQKG